MDQGFWFEWVAFHPETEVFSIKQIIIMLSNLEKFNRIIRHQDIEWDSNPYPSNVVLLPSIKNILQFINNIYQY